MVLHVFDGGRGIQVRIGIDYRDHHAIVAGQKTAVERIFFQVPILEAEN